MIYQKASTRKLLIKTSNVGQLDPDGFVETEDYVEMNGRRIEKPFVEKPVSGDNHNIFIYYPQQMVLQFQS